MLVAKYLFGAYISVPVNPDSMSKCPDRWTFKPATAMCEPAYSTQCTPFNPSAPTLYSAAAKCELAKRCNTDWSGVCM
jgi:hypothetical protein